MRSMKFHSIVMTVGNQNKPGVIFSHLSKVCPKISMSIQENVIIVIPNLKASVWEYMFVL